jgi:hypothetical protein
MIDQRAKFSNLLPGETRGSYRYIHIWASLEEIRVQCTDPQTIRVLIRAIKKAFNEIQVETKKDLTGQVYVVKLTGISPDDHHQKVAWWLFKMMCVRGWEPMETGDNWYKMKGV